MNTLITKGGLQKKHRVLIHILWIRGGGKPMWGREGGGGGGGGVGGLTEDIFGGI